VPVDQTVGYSGNGDFAIAANGQLTRGAGGVYGGVQIIKTQGLEAIEESAFSLNLLWDEMLSNNRLYGLSYTGRWCDVGHPDGIGLAEKMMNV
jgi:MurNAc alpha-1-phosphate uridylyltransferase